MVFFYLILLSVQLFASEVLLDVNVTTSKNASDFYSGGFDRLDKDDLARSSNDISQILSTIPGITSYSSGGLGSKTTISIRGGESRHTGVSIDGLRLNDPSNTDRQFDGTYLHPLKFSGVNVYKGPQSIFYGPDAMAGLIDFETSKGTGKDLFSFYVGGGSFDTFQTMLLGDWASKNHQGRLSVSTFKTSGLSRLNKKRFNATERDSSSSIDVMSSSRHIFNRVTTDLLVGITKGESELDGWSTDNAHDNSLSKQFYLQQKSSYKVDNTSTLNLRTGQNYIKREIDMIGRDDLFKGVSSQLDFYWDYRNQSNHFLLGTSIDHESFKENNYLDKNNILFSQYLIHKWHHQKFEVSYGLRNDQHQRFGNHLTYSLSPAIKLGSMKLDYTYTTGFKAPGLYQLYGYDPIYGNSGNKNLKEEESFSQSINLHYFIRNNELSLSLFSNRYENLIVWGVDGYINQDEFRAKGFEFGIKGSRNNLSWKPYFVAQDFVGNSSKILRRPRNQMGIDLAYRIEDKIELWGKYEKRSSVFDTNNLKINGHEKIDAGMSYFLNHNTYSLKIFNVLNREYEHIAGFTTMPRSFMIEWSGTIE